MSRSKDMAQSKRDDVSEAEIAVHWQEEAYVHPPEKFVAQANLTDPKVFDRFSLKNFPDCFKEYADLLDWYKTWDVTLDTSKPPFWKWFVGGRINVSYNCVDRHLPRHKNKTAVHFVPEPEHEAIQHVTYQELYVRVNEMAAVLQDFCGLKKGDRVTLHMPMVAELPISMLACARLGVIHSQVFSGFSGKATADRIVDSESRVLITMDGYYRGGELLDHKEKANIAFDEAAKEGVRLEKVLVWQRHPGRYSSKTPLVEGRDFVVNEVLSLFRHRRVDPVQMPAEDPLFLMYTSGTTGKPKGCQHSTGDISPTWRAPRNTFRTSIPRTSTGAWPISVGSPVIPTLCTDLWLSPPPVSCMRGFRPFPTPGVHGASPKSSTSIYSTPRRRRSARCGAQGPTSRRNITTGSSI